MRVSLGQSYTGAAKHPSDLGALTPTPLFNCNQILAPQHLLVRPQLLHHFWAFGQIYLALVSKARLLQAVLWICKWTDLHTSPPATPLEPAGWLGPSSTAAITKRKEKKKKSSWAEKRHPGNIPWEYPFYKKGQTCLLLSTSESWTGLEGTKTLMKYWLRGKFQSELATNRTKQPLETKLHYFHWTQSYFLKVSLTWNLRNLIK